MFHELGNHLWQSTLCAGVVWLLALLLRNHRAAIRYALWLAASVKFLVPFALLVSAGNFVGQRSEPAPVVRSIPVAIEQFSVPFTSARPVSAPPQHDAWPAILGSAWLLGSAIALFCWIRAWLRIREVRRNAHPVDLRLPLPALQSPGRIEPGIFGIWRPVLLLPERIQERLTPQQFRAVLAHELAHVRRRDNLTAAIHLAVETIFWFHPLVWWIGGRLMEERENACDEEAVRQANDPESYAEGILNVCRLFVESPSVCLSGISGADLKKRVQFILSRGAARRLDAGRRLMLSAAGALVVAGPIALGVLHPRTSRAQEKAPVFEVASVKPSRQPVGDSSWNSSPAGTIRMKNETLKDLIRIAYGVKDTQIVGGAKWMDGEGYNVDGKAPAPANDKQMLLMLQSLLVERFQLSLHRESRSTQGYALVVGKSGIKIKPVEPGQKNQLNTKAGHMVAKAASMPKLSEMLARFVGAPVIDETHLDGVFDFNMDWDPEDAMSIASALQDQLGLKLEGRKLRTEVLVIDRAERPSDN